MILSSTIRALDCVGWCLVDSGFGRPDLRVGRSGRLQLQADHGDDLPRDRPQAAVAANALHNGGTGCRRTAATAEATADHRPGGIAEA